ncbi:hypothetical protein ACET8R_09125 [Aeromonas veronii]
MNNALHNQIMASAPAFYFKLDNMAAYPALNNLGDQPITAQWKGGPPAVVETSAGPMVWLKGPEWVELKNGPAALATGNGFTIETMLLIDDERRAYWRVFELGVNTTSPLFSLTIISTTDDFMARYWTPGQSSSSPQVTYPGIRSRLHHIMAVVDPVAGKVRHYLDGALIAEVANSYSLNSINAALGNMFYSLWPQNGITASDQTFMGLASYVAVYLKPLTAADAADRAATIPSLGGDWSILQFAGVFNHQITAVAANQEPRSQFQPQDVVWRGTPPMYAGPVNLRQQTQYPLCKGRDYYWIRDGVRNVEQGYIESTVTINGVGVRRRVLCFTQDGELVGETYSRASDGVYRFDLLWLNKRYMLVAQDDPAFGPADYNAVAADYQAPKPYPPGGGVAPAPFPMLAPLKRK